jgi:hypothetical protein
MKKCMALLLVLFCWQAVVKAQQKPLLIDPVKDKREKNGYTIQLKMAPSNTVLFDIWQTGKPVFNQPNNPVTMLPQGFESKDDAWKVAEWMVGEYNGQAHFPPMVPPHVARQLNVKTGFNQSLKQQL